MRRARVGLVPGLVLGLVVVAEAASVGLSWGRELALDTLLYVVYAVVKAAAGALVVTRHPRHPIGWLFLGSAALSAASDAAQGWALAGAARDWAGVAAGEVLTTVSWLLDGWAITLIFLLFPDGRLPGRRWRVVVWTVSAGVVLAVPAWAMLPGRDGDFSSGRNPLEVDSPAVVAAVSVGLALFLGSFVASVVGLVVRFRRSRGTERQQLKWFAYVAAVAGVAMPLVAAFWYVTWVAQVVSAVTLTAIPVGASVGILRYRLYDIDVIIDRTLVYAAVTLVLAAAYVTVVVTLGTWLGGGSGVPTAVATAVVAVAFRPLRDRVQDALDHRFHRARYEARRRMAAFLEELRAGRAAPQDVQDVLREVLDDATLRLLVFLPESELYVDVQGAAADLAGVSGQRVDVERGGRPLGVVVHNRARSDGPALVREVVEAGGLAIEITRLQVELRRQLAEVEASRARIVTAANQERRRIERDLHDGAQQRLVAIGLALRHAQHQLGTSPAAQAVSTIDAAVAEITVAIRELRELAHGLPPAQLDAGLAPAFRDLARRAVVPVQVDMPAERFDRGLEGAVWFIGCEGVTNAVKHSRATRIALRAERSDGRVTVTVTDDGVGGAVPAEGSGLTGLADRVAALGGVLRIESAPGAGTTLTAELPCGS